MLFFLATISTDDWRRGWRHDHLGLIVPYCVLREGVFPRLSDIETVDPCASGTPGIVASLVPLTVLILTGDGTVLK